MKLLILSLELAICSAHTLQFWREFVAIKGAVKPEAVGPQKAVVDLHADSQGAATLILSDLRIKPSRN
jgi:hypothetical protein